MEVIAVCLCVLACVIVAALTWRDIARRRIVAATQIEPLEARLVVLETKVGRLEGALAGVTAQRLRR